MNKKRKLNLVNLLMLVLFTATYLAFWYELLWLIVVACGAVLIGVLAIAWEFTDEC